MGTKFLSNGFPLIPAVLGVLIICEVIPSFEEMWRDRQKEQIETHAPQSTDNTLSFAERRKLMPFVGVSAVVGTVIGALPGIGSTLAATLGFASGQRMRKGPVPFGSGTPRAWPQPKRPEVLSRAQN